MVPVIFERRCDEPKTFDMLLDLVRRGRPCLDTYHVTPLIHGLSADGLRFLCVYEAPDAEAVRRSVEALGNPVGTQTWPVTAEYKNHFDRAGLPWARQRFVMISHDLTGEAQNGDADDLDPLDTICCVGYSVDLAAEFTATDGQRKVRLYVAPDIEAIRRVQSELPLSSLFSAIPHSD